MEDRGVKLIGVMEMDDRGFKERLIGAILRPSIVPFVDVGVMEFITVGFELIPLHARMEDVHNIVEDFVEREFRLWPCFASFQTGLNVSVKVFTRDFRWNSMIDERRACGVGLGIHRHILPDEESQFLTQILFYYPFILAYLYLNLTMSSIVSH